MITKTYLGDSVYAEYDGYAIILTLDGIGQNAIILEPSVYKNLISFGNQTSLIDK